MQLFLDSNVFLYAIGPDHPLKSHCAKILRAVAGGEVMANTSTEVVQEVLFVVGRRGDKQAATRASLGILRLFPELLPVTRDDMLRACTIYRESDRIPPRDAVHAATMLNNHLTHIVSADRDFERIEGIRSVDPSAPMGTLR